MMRIKLSHTLGAREAYRDRDMDRTVDSLSEINLSRVNKNTTLIVGNFMFYWRKTCVHVDVFIVTDKTRVLVFFSFSKWSSSRSDFNRRTTRTSGKISDSPSKVSIDTPLFCPRNRWCGMMNLPYEWEREVWMSLLQRISVKNNVSETNEYSFVSPLSMLCSFFKEEMECFAHSLCVSFHFIFHLCFCLSEKLLRWTIRSLKARSNLYFDFLVCQRRYWAMTTLYRQGKTCFTFENVVCTQLELQRRAASFSHRRSLGSHRSFGYVPRASRRRGPSVRHFPSEFPPIHTSVTLSTGEHMNNIMTPSRSARIDAPIMTFFSCSETLESPTKREKVRGIPSLSSLLVFWTMCLFLVHRIDHNGALTTILKRLSTGSCDHVWWKNTVNLDLCSNLARKLFECFREPVRRVTQRWTATRDLFSGEANVFLCLLLIFSLVMIDRKSVV